MRVGTESTLCFLPMNRFAPLFLTGGAFLSVLLNSLKTMIQATAAIDSIFAAQECSPAFEEARAMLRPI